jgi:hypothetical protein
MPSIVVITSSQCLEEASQVVNTELRGDWVLVKCMVQVVVELRCG